MNEIREITDKHIFYAIKPSQLITIYHKTRQVHFQILSKTGVEQLQLLFSLSVVINTCLEKISQLKKNI